MSNVEDTQCLSTEALHQHLVRTIRSHTRQEKKKIWTIEEKEGSCTLICHNCLCGLNTNTRTNIHKDFEALRVIGDH